MSVYCILLQTWPLYKESDMNVKNSSDTQKSVKTLQRKKALSLSVCNYTMYSCSQKELDPVYLCSFMCIHAVFASLNTQIYISQKCTLQSEISSRSYIISAAQINDVMMIRLAGTPMFADWLKTRMANGCRE